MGKLAALKPHAVEIKLRTTVEVDFDALILSARGSRPIRVPLANCVVEARDAQLFNRFVRHLRVVLGNGHLDLVTPPEDGSIAPRCAGLADAPQEALVVERPTFDVVTGWLVRNGSLRSQTIAQLAALAAVASSAYAVHIGERAAQIAVDMTSDIRGPLRGCPSPRQVLAPLVQVARYSERASEALVAALAMTTVLY